jgi:maltose alpha-D-glucosyltransferase/alpha-amylase
MRDFLQWRCRDAILLAEANVPPKESLKYFGEEGDRLQMMLNFPVNQRLFYALATADIGPLVEALEQTADRPPNAQWVQFLRSHDELDLGRLTQAQRERVFEAFAPDENMRLYNRGIRRRLAPMLGNDRRKLELAFSLLLSLPGTPMMQYGDEIGIGEDLSLPEREAARTPMQWTSEKHAGFSRAETIFRPVIDDETYGYQKVNAADQSRDAGSMLNWTERRTRMRHQCPEIGWGSYKILDTGAPPVLAIRYDWCETSLLTLHNFSPEPQDARIRLNHPGNNVLVNLFAKEQYTADEGKAHHVHLEGYGHHWLRVGGIDTALDRASF